MWSTEPDSDGTENEFKLSEGGVRIIENFPLKLPTNQQQKKMSKRTTNWLFSVILSYFKALFLSLKRTFVQSDEYFCDAELKPQ